MKKREDKDNMISLVDRILSNEIRALLKDPTIDHSLKEKLLSENLAEFLKAIRAVQKKAHDREDNRY